MANGLCFSDLGKNLVITINITIKTRRVIFNFYPLSPLRLERTIPVRKEEKE